MEKIILASASPRRRELLTWAGVAFTVLPAEGEERITSEVPQEVVEQLSRQKARAVAGQLKDVGEGTVLIGADTVVSCKGRILGKPSDEEDAVRTLLLLQGKTHQVYTGVTLLVKRKGAWEEHTFSECTQVTVYPVQEETIRAYVRTGDPMDKAGSYAIQGGFGIYVKEIQGDYNNVIGLPVSRLLYEMRALGIAY